MSSNDQSSATVMVVDDSDDLRFMITHFLVVAGYKVVEASNGLEAVALVRRKCPNLILMDLNMPLLDGMGAMSQIRECDDLPVIAISAYDSIEIKDAARRAGFDDYVTKPIDFDRLEHVINRFLNR